MCLVYLKDPIFEKRNKLPNLYEKKGTKKKFQPKFHRTNSTKLTENSQNSQNYKLNHKFNRKTIKRRCLTIFFKMGFRCDLSLKFGISNPNGHVKRGNSIYAEMIFLHLEDIELNGFLVINLMEIFFF